jgi:hypothetical protein
MPGKRSRPGLIGLSSRRSEGFNQATIEPASEAAVCGAAGCQIEEGLFTIEFDDGFQRTVCWPHVRLLIERRGAS